MDKQKTLGLYIHIPFCKSRCPYCGFYSVAQTPDDRFISAMIKEIQIESGYFKNRQCDTLYFGGGTPSSLSIEQLAMIVQALKESFDIAANAEITMEMNPSDMSDEYIEKTLEMGINRISVGVQSNHDRLLKKIGRKHSAAEAESAVRRAFHKGYRNISIDLMSELPGQSAKDFEGTLKWAVHLPVTHMSVYSLIIEEKTGFARMNEKGILQRPTENESWEMYQDMCRILPHYGFARYEISSFARKGHESVHNQKYWKLEDYLGLGPAACSRIGRKRIENLQGLRNYEKEIMINGQVPKEVTVLSEKEEMEEFCFLGLRMKNGINKKGFKKKYGQDIHDIYDGTIRALVEKKLLEETEEDIFMTYKGTALGNYVFQQFLLDK